MIKTRREFLKYAGLGALAFGVPLLLKVKDAHAAVTYFGFGVNSDGTTHGTPSPDAGYGNGFIFNVWLDMTGSAFATHAADFTVPGVGNMDVVDISAYTDATAGSPQMQLAIYSADGTTLMAYGTSAITIAAGAAWQGHQSGGVITQNAPLVGGTRYIIFEAHGSAGTFSIQRNSDDATASVSNWNTSTGYIGAIPTPLPSPTGTMNLVMQRVGVQPAAGGAAPVRHRIIQ